MATTTTETQAATSTFPRMILILNSIKFAYECILHYSAERCQKWLDAFKSQELETVTFCATTVQNGEDKLLIELEIGIDWDTYEELAKISPDVTLPDIPGHTASVLITINEAVNTYLELFNYARTKFPDCESSTWYYISKRIWANEELLSRTREKLGLSTSGKYPSPYSGEQYRNTYNLDKTREIHTNLRIYFD